MKVLMATDGSHDALTAMRAAAQLVRKENSQVQVVCVIPELFQAKSKTREAGEQSRRVRDRYRRQISRETRKILDEATRLLAEDGITAESVMEFGSPANVIVHKAASQDLTVIGALGKYDRTRLGLGPVANRVIESAPGMILVGRELTPEKSLRILVGVDGSEASEQALRRLVTEFNVNSAEITLMHVVETPWIKLGLDRDFLDAPDEWSDSGDQPLHLERELRAEAEMLVDEARRILQPYQVSIDTVIEEGNAATELLGQVENGDYDLIVLGATGLTDLRHGLVGSVSSKVAWTALCSVLIVKTSA